MNERARGKQGDQEDNDSMIKSGSRVSFREQMERLIPVVVRIIRWGILATLLAPLLTSARFFFPAIVLKTVYVWALIEVLAVLYLWLITVAPAFRPRISPILLMATLYILVMGVATLTGVDPERSFWSIQERMGGLIGLLHIFVFFLMASSVFSRRRDWHLLFFVSVSIAVLTSLIFLMARTRFIVTPSLPGFHEGATLGNSSFLATYLLFNGFFALYLIFIIRRLIGRIVFTGLTFFLMLTIFISGGRAASLALILGLIFLAPLWLSVKKQGGWRWIGWVLCLVFFAAGLVLLYLSFRPGSMVHEFVRQRFTLARPVVWEIAWKSFLERPILGWGPENFEIPFTKYFNPCLFVPECGGEPWFDRVHNVVLDHLVNAGVIGLASYLGIFIAVFMTLWQRLRQKRVDFVLAGIFSVLLGAYFLQNLTVFDTITSYLMFFLVLAFLSQLDPPAGNKFSPLSAISTRRLGVGLAILPFSVLFFIDAFLYSIFYPLKANFHMVGVHEAPDFETRLHHTQKALDREVLGSNQIKYILGQKIYDLLELGFSPESVRPELELITSELEERIRDQPLDLRSRIILGSLYTHFSRLDQTKAQEAAKIFEEAIALAPSNQYGYWGMANLKEKEGAYQEALSFAETALVLEPRSQFAQKRVIEIAYSIDPELAAQKIKEARIMFPNLEIEFVE